jgi:hypothetical protein
MFVPPKQWEFPMKCGWVDKRRAYAVSTQRRALIEDGVPEMKIYDGAQHPRSAAFRDCGQDGTLVVYTLGCLARDRGDFTLMTAELRALGIQRLTIREVGRKGGPIEATLPLAAGEMLARCFADWAQVRLSPAEARRHGRKGAAAAKAKLKRMPEAEALAIWLDTTTYRTADDALEAMWGWSKSSAYRLTKGRGRGTGVQKTKRQPAPKRRRKVRR